jgi:predicted MFS family arabinose efflux permease
MAAGFCSMLNLYAPQAILPTLARIFHASPVGVGLTITATTLGVAVFGPFAGAAADRFGLKRAIVVSLLALAVPTIASGLSTSLDQLIVTRFLQGLFMPAAFAASLGYVAQEWTASDVSRVMSLYVTGNLAGGFAGRFFGGVAATYADWHWAFFGLAAINIAGAAIVWICLPSPSRPAPRFGLGQSLFAIAGHLRNRRLLAVYAVGFNVLFALVDIFTYVNFHLGSPPFSMGPTALGLVFCVYLVGIAVTPAAGRWIGRIGQRQALLAAAGAASLGLAVTLIPSVPVIIFGLALFCSSVFVCQAAATSRIGRVAGEHRSSAAGLYLTFYYGGGALGAVLPGYAYGALGWTGCVGLAIAIQIVVATTAYRLWAD